MRGTNENLESYNSSKRLVPIRLRELHESKFSFVLRIEFIRSKISNFSAHVSGVSIGCPSSVSVGYSSCVGGAVPAVAVSVGCPSCVSRLSLAGSVGCPSCVCGLSQSYVNVLTFCASGQ